jgi:hypothetical protein
MATKSSPGAVVRSPGGGKTRVFGTPRYGYAHNDDGAHPACRGRPIAEGRAVGQLWNAVVPFGVPSPVGPSQPVVALHHFDVVQLPLEPLVTSLRLPVWAHG